MRIFLGTGLMKLLFKYHKQVRISNQEKGSNKYNIQSQINATCYEEIVLPDNSSAIDWSQNVAYGEVKELKHNS